MVQIHLDRQTVTLMVGSGLIVWLVPDSLLTVVLAYFSSYHPAVWGLLDRFSSILSVSPAEGEVSNIQSWSKLARSVLRQGLCSVRRPEA